MTDHLEAASKAADRGRPWDMTVAQAHASIAIASALENIGTAISCLTASAPRVTPEQRGALALLMAEWWQNAPISHTGGRLEYVLDCLLDELGVTK